jgi:hypothetical protein
LNWWRLVELKLGEYTEILRSKNAGPYCQTIDLVYSSADKYELVKKSGILNIKKIAQLYKLAGESVEINYFDSAFSIKISFPRKHSCGSWRDADCYGAQQHMPLMDLEIEI